MSEETPDEGERENDDGARRAQHDIGGRYNYTCGPDLGGQQVIHTTKYGSEVLQGIKTKVSTIKNPAWKSANQHVEAHVDGLADLGASASIILWNLEKILKLTIYENGDATLKDARNNHMDVSGRGEIMVNDKYGIPHKIKVLISRDLLQDKLVVELEDFKDLGTLHLEYLRTLPEKRREGTERREKKCSTRA